MPSGHNRRRRLATRSSGKQQAGRTAVRTAPIVCPEESHPACINQRQLCRKQFPLTGIDAPTPAREKGLQPSWGTHLLRRRSEEGAGGRAESHPASMTRDSFAVRNSPLRGPDAPTPARIGTCRPKERSHFSFGGERKVCKRKAAARRLREKALYCPFWRRGSLCRAQRSWPATPAIVRARSSPFSAAKMGGPFSLRCLSPLCSPAVGGGQAYPLRVGMFRCSLEIFASQKASGISNPCWPF